MIVNIYAKNLVILHKYALNFTCILEWPSGKRCDDSDKRLHSIWVGSAS